MRIAINKIKISDRIREDLGDIEALKKSITKNGLLNPITVTNTFELLAGFRRLTAVKELGWKEIDCNIVDVKSKLDKLEIEVEENIARKDFTHLELLLYEERKNYLNTHGFKRFILWLMKMLTKLLRWITSKKDKKRQYQAQ